MNRPNLEIFVLHDPPLGRLQHHGAGGESGDEDHDPVEVGDEAEELVQRLEPDLSLLAGQGVLECGVVAGVLQPLADLAERRFAGHWN